MGWLALTLTMTLPMAGAPELVAVPMTTDGVGAAEGLEAWKVVRETLDGAKGDLGVSMRLQDKRHDFLVGPAREQVNDCAGDVGCLRELGGVLGVDVLVTGQVTATNVALVAIEVPTGRVVGEANTPAPLAKAPLAGRAESAVRMLIVALGGGEPAADPAASNPAVAGGPVAGVPGAEPAPDSGGLKGFDDEPGTAPNRLPPPPAATPPPRMQGRLRIARDQLVGVQDVRIDGEAVPFQGDGSVEWAGAPGDHTLVASRADGTRLRRNVFLEPSSLTNVVLEFPSDSPTAPPAVTTAEGDGESVTGKWWFWTSIGAAVAAGAATAAVLAGGVKGGPSLPGDAGSIRGSY